MPKGRPTTSAERMRLKRLREQGLAAPVRTCKQCGTTLKPTAGSSKASKLDMCWACWKVTPEGKLDRRRLNLKGSVWAIGYVVRNDQGQHAYVANLRQALSHPICKGKSNCILAAIWSNGEVSLHPGLTTKNCSGLRPEDGDSPLGETDWFLSFVPEDKRTWFG